MRGTVPFRQAFQKFALVQCTMASPLHLNLPSSRKGSQGLSYYRGWNKYCTSRTQFQSECGGVLKIAVNPPAPPRFQCCWWLLCSARAQRATTPPCRLENKLHPWTYAFMGRPTSNIEIGRGREGRAMTVGRHA